MMRVVDVTATHNPPIQSSIQPSIPPSTIRTNQAQPNHFPPKTLPRPDPAPECRPICFCGRMICTLCALFVFGIGCDRMQIARTTRLATRVFPGK